jgi:hypothetical protein
MDLISFLTALDALERLDPMQALRMREIASELSEEELGRMHEKLSEANARLAEENAPLEEIKRDIQNLIDNPHAFSREAKKNEELSERDFESQQAEALFDDAVQVTDEL